MVTIATRIVNVCHRKPTFSSGDWVEHRGTGWRATVIRNMPNDELLVDTEWATQEVWPKRMCLLVEGRSFGRLALKVVFLSTVAFLAMVGAATVVLVASEVIVP